MKDNITNKNLGISSAKISKCDSIKEIREWIKNLQLYILETTKVFKQQKTFSEKFGLNTDEALNFKTHLFWQNILLEFAIKRRNELTLRDTHWQQKLKEQVKDSCYQDLLSEYSTLKDPISLHSKKQPYGDWSNIYLSLNTEEIFKCYDIIQLKIWLSTIKIYTGLIKNNNKTKGITRGRKTNLMISNSLKLQLGYWIGVMRRNKFGNFWKEAYNAKRKIQRLQ